MENKIKLVVDAGHGGTDTGAVANGLTESVLNLKVALYVKEYLLAYSEFIEVKLSRDSNITTSLQARVDLANKWGADYIISIHHNAGRGDGAEIIHSIHAQVGKPLAQEIMVEFEKTGQNSRKIYSRVSEKANKDYYAIIRNTKGTCVITEYAFLDSADHEAVDTEQELKTEAKAIVLGFINHLKREGKL